MKDGLLITNGFVQREQFLSLYANLLRAAKERGYSLTQVANTSLHPSITHSEARPGFGIFWDKDVRLAYALEQDGMRLFNSARAIELCDDKALTHLALADKLPMPETRLIPFSFPKVGYPDMGFLEEGAEALGFPLVIKECFGSFGMQVYLARDMQEAQEILQRIQGVPAILQQFIAESAGRDVRVYVIGGEAAAAIERQGAPGEFCANIGRGGSARPAVLTPEQKRIAELAARELQLDFCGVDLLFGKDGPVLIEVNSNAHFAGITAATGVDIAGRIVEHVFETAEKL